MATRGGVEFVSAELTTGAAFARVHGRLTGAIEERAMNSRGHEKYRTELIELRRRLRSDADTVAGQARRPSGGQENGDLSNAPFHLADSGTDEFLHDMSAALAENEAYLWQEIADALRRINDGNFGRCEGCGQTIPRQRLDAMPYVRFCVACADRLQAGLPVNLNTGRPRSPADTLAPEGAMQEGWRRDKSDPFGAGRNTVANDEHAVGEPGGGAAIGGLAGSNSGDGEPEVSDLQDAAGSGEFDVDDARDEERSEAPRSGRSGGAVGGTPARKRST
jgi:RNA polymerase-binding transcription factor DksA